MSELTATPALVRFVLRRDRVRIAGWILAIGGLMLTTVASVKGIYPTQASLDRAALAIEGNAAVIALNGPPIGLDTLGGRVVFESGSFGLVVVALMSVLMIGRHTRAEEESGRTELVRAVVVGRFAPLAAALIVARFAPLSCRSIRFQVAGSTDEQQEHRSSSGHRCREAQPLPRLPRRRACPALRRGVRQHGKQQWEGARRKERCDAGSSGEP